MASFPSFASTGTLKLEPDSTKHSTVSLLTRKSPSIPYPKSQTSTPSESLNFQESLSVITDGSKIETSCYVPLLQECIERTSFSGAQNFHSHIIKTGTHQDVFVMTFLVNVYAKCGSMENAQKVFNKLPRRNVVAWTTLMTGYVHNDQSDVAISVFQEMLEFGSFPTNYTLGIALNACSAINSVELGKQIHGYGIKYHIDHDTSVGNSLCSLYSKCANLDSAIKAFLKIGEKNVVSWTAVICACGDNSKALKGLRFFTEMLADNVEPNEFTLTSVLSMCCTMLSLSFGVQVHCLSIKLGYEPNLRIRNSIMYLYLRCGRFGEALRLFNGMDDLSLVTMNSIIAGYGEMMELAKDDLSAYCNGTEALNVFSKLNNSGFKPDIYSFSSILTVCSKMFALEQGEQVHAQTLKTGHLSDMIVGTALVNMYNKCGSIERASKAFREMSARTLISWTSMIAAFAQNGQTQQALQLFEDMRLMGVRPNQVTFVGVLSACAHAGMVNEALGYFETMQKDFKIKPVMDHYSCLIDMFVRLGLLNEAFVMIKNMDFPPNESIWSLLLAGCKRDGNTALGFYVAEKLLELKPKNTETCLLLLNMYKSADRWEDVSKVQELMKEKRLKKLMDWSWISIHDKVYSFKPDERQAYGAEMYDYLDQLLDKAKSLVGYESLESLGLLEVEEEEGKTLTSNVQHSEKLAVAFGLLNMPNAAPIRIIKNISMCRGCHNFMKAISSLNAREIIIRDSKRLHKFVNGQCSCGDYGGLL
ncbi:pentatricopeptide repeat-containing protein isoform X2 [Gossypium australe]|uniref:Pentatricopeptide repeat-containing protein isoform X2 n=1 Tax=Gossypium australe TaxID=47621 RepID=A0A5B6W3Z3_9ROSI|nr:pentatricopeptide repeat-containing protein isoform X2 [Gossypium australe]